MNLSSSTALIVCRMEAQFAFVVPVKISSTRPAAAEAVEDADAGRMVADRAGRAVVPAGRVDRLAAVRVSATVRPVRLPILRLPQAKATPALKAAGGVAADVDAAVAVAEARISEPFAHIHPAAS